MIRILVLLLATLAGLSSADARKFHVDSARGSDQGSGLSPDEAWQSLDRANASTLKPGDQLLFRSGGRWSGQLRPQGRGSASAPVSIGRYGDGALPRIDGEGRFRDAVLLRNIPFLEIADLEITNRGAETAPWRTGVRVSAEDVGKLRRITLKRLFVHDVNGDLRKSHEGCGIFFQAKGGNSTHFDGLLIENCRVERTDRNGICQRGSGGTRSRHVVIRGNTLEDIGGDGIKLWGTNGGLIEKNVVRKARSRCADAAAGIWPFACDDTMIQCNEVSGTIGTKDGQAYDSDYSCRRTTFQYNYSFENEGGFMLICAPGRSYNEDTVIRYNISVHDGIDSARVFHFGGGATRTHVYNNTVVIGPHQDLPMLLFTEWSGGKAKDSRFTNNLFIVEQGGRATYKLTPSKGNTFDSNLFLGRHVGLPQNCRVITAPDVTAPLKPRPGTDWLKVLRPVNTDDSLRGRIIDANGGRDFFGSPVSASDPPTIGALER